MDQPNNVDQQCSIPQSEIFSGGPGKDGIPALSNPEMAGVGGEGTEYLLPDHRVVGIKLGGEVLAVPIPILWWHEIVNLDVGGIRLAVTHCPLTGSSLVFDRSSIDGAELGVSGLLFQNNLIMYDRTAQESLWPQMARRARCGSRNGTNLQMIPAWEMSWEGWSTLHPETQVVTSHTGHRRDYRAYPYGDYDRIDNSSLLFPLRRIDATRPPKERTLGIPDGTGGISFPFGLLDALGNTAVVNGENEVVFWDGGSQAAMAFSTTLNGQSLSFTVIDEEIRDEQTNSVWRIDGAAIAGPNAGEQLAPVPEAFVSYWFAWAAFQPNAIIGIE